jgi:hypothetical protein
MTFSDSAIIGFFLGWAWFVAYPVEALAIGLGNGSRQDHHAASNPINQSPLASQNPGGRLERNGLMV